MFESIEIRQAANGYILIVHTEEETREYVYDTARKLMSAVKQYISPKSSE